MYRFSTGTKVHDLERSKRMYMYTITANQKYNSLGAQRFNSCICSVTELYFTILRLPFYPKVTFGYLLSEFRL